jgi:hypothetical protein
MWQQCENERNMTDNDMMAGLDAESRNVRAANIFDCLQSEIERVTRKHERWKGMLRDCPELGIGFKFSMEVMGQTIKNAQRELSSLDPEGMMIALKSLQGYGNDD